MLDREQILDLLNDMQTYGFEIVDSVVDVKVSNEDIAEYIANNYEEESKSNQLVPQIYIKDNDFGNIRLFGTNVHDRLIMTEDKKHLYYLNLQNGESSEFETYNFENNEDGVIDEEELKFDTQAAYSIYNKEMQE